MTALALIQSAPVLAAEAPEPEILVVAERIAGSVQTEVPPVGTYDELAIESLGASSITDILTALAPQTRSGGRGGGGRPVTLLNGRRVSGFAELRDLPPEAIRRVEVFPEEVAVRFGFPPEQRVINFILKDGFSAITVEGEYRWPEAGDRSEWEGQASLFKATKQGRLNLSAEWNQETALSEAARGIVQTDGSQFARTLLPRSEAWALNAVYNQRLGEATGMTLNLAYDDSDQQGRFGLPAGALIGSDPLERDTRDRLLHGGLTLDGPIGRWNWTLTSNLDQRRRTTLTDRNTGGAEPLPRDLARSRAFNGDALLTLRGSVAELPAGPLAVTLRGGLDRDVLTSLTDRGAGTLRARVSRTDTNGRISIDVPLASRKRGSLAGLGEFSVNASYGLQSLSDFGTQTQYGYGATWTPIRNVTLTATFKAEDAAPTPQQLGDPRIAFPNSQIFDFVRGETVFATLLTGGNAALRADRRRDWKLGLSIKDLLLEDLSLDASYNRVRSTDPVSSFPALTAQTEAAFAGRVIRGADGRIVSVDQSAVNFGATRSDSLRWGLSYSKSFGQPAGRGDGAGGPGGARGFMPGRPQGGRWSLSLYHSVRFKDQVLLAAGQPVIDLLRGDTIGNEGGSPRHELELEGGWFHKGKGLRVTGSWQNGTRVNGVEPLRFSDRTSVDVRAFYSFSGNPKLVERVPFLKGFRIAVQVRNLFDDAIRVRDSAGNTPFRFQRGYLEPLGRNFEIDLRKQF